MEKQNNPPFLSLCMIVKNEEENLERFFNQVQGYFGEIIVVDTGSTDTTLKLAENAGAKVIKKRWENNFSEARNESLKHASGEWIVVLDADEYLDKENYDKLVKTIKNNEGSAYYLNFRSVIPESKAGNILINSHPRVFRNGLGIVYKGRIHEQIIDSVYKQGKEILPTDIMVEHYGYKNAAGGRQAKIKRNIEILEKETEENPGNAINYFYLGEEYSLLFDWEKAISYYEKAVLKGTLPAFNRSILHQNLATAYLNSELYRKAIEEAEIALELNNTLFTPFLIIAEAQFTSGNYNGTLWQLKNLLRRYQQMESKKKLLYLHHEPNFTYIYKLLGDSYLTINDIENAEKSYLEALNHDDKDIGALIGLMKISYKKENYENAFKYLETALRIKPDYYKLYLYQGELYFHLQDYQRAKSAFIKSMLSPENKDNKRYLLSLCYYHLHEYDKAVTELKKNSEHILSLNLLCDIYDRQNKTDEVESVLKNIISLEEDNSINYFNLGLHYEKRGQKEEAGRAFRQAITLNDKEPQSLFYYGTFLLREGKFSESIKLLTAASELSPRTPEIWHNLAVANIKSEKYPDAIKAFEKLLGINPSDKNVKRRIASVYAKMGDIENAERYLMMSKK